MSNFELRAEPRSVVGKKVRFLRRQGVVPGNVYGQSASTPVQLAAKDLEQTIRRAGRTHLVSLAVGSEKTTVLVKDWQRHPFKGELLHVDFVRVSMTETMRIDVPVRLVGDAPAVKSTGGTALQSHATVSVECLPGNLPEAIEVDISGLAEIDDAIHVRDLTAPSGVTILTDGDELVVKIMAPTVEAEDSGEAPVTAEIGSENSSDSDSE